MSLALAIPALLLALIEGGLRLVGVGYPTAFCLQSPGSADYIENRKFVWQFYSPKTNLRPNPFVVPAVKRADTLRLVVLGESAAAGTPDPAYSFGRILERMLRRELPNRRIEVINAAINGINSHIVLRVARDCARLKPDLFIVYMGNNEAVGLHAPGPHTSGLAGHLFLLRASQWAHTLRIGQCLDSLLSHWDRQSDAAQNQDAAFFERHRIATDDPRRLPIYANFRSNLEGICSAAEHAGAGLVLMTVPVNLKDCPPLGSLHRQGLAAPELARWDAEYAAGAQAEAAGQHALALGHFLAAASLDKHFAELHFHLGRCCQALEQSARFREEFALARDWDALPFRTDSKLNDIIRQKAKEKSQAARATGSALKLVDAERLFAEAEPDGVPGQRFFADHVHPKFEGNYLLAKALLPVVREALAQKAEFRKPESGPEPAVLSQAECAAQLAFTRVNELQTAQQLAQTTALPPFTSQLEHAQRQKALEQKLKEQFAQLGQQDFEVAAGIYRSAIRQAPEDWHLTFNFGQLLLMEHDYSAAVIQFAAAKERMSHWVPIRIGLSVALNGVGQRSQALEELREALLLAPESEAVKTGLAAMEAK